MYNDNNYTHGTTHYFLVEWWVLFYSKIYELGSLAFESDDNSETKINYYYNFMLDFIESHGNLVTSLKSRCLI